MRFYTEKRGFTLIEVVVVMAIFGILFLALGSFLITNVKLFNSAETQTELQNQAQSVMDSVSEYLLSTKGISNPSDENPSFDGTTFKKVTMKNADDSLIPETVISYDNLKKELKLSTGSSNKLLSNNITAFTIEPISAKTPNAFSDCIGFRIRLTVTIKEQKLDLTNEVFFRNKT